MTLEDRVAYLEALLSNLHRQGLPGGPAGPLGGLVLETQWSHKSAFSIGTLDPIGFRVEVENPPRVERHGSRVRRLMGQVR